MFTLEHDVPFPPTARRGPGSAPKYPLGMMSVGHSFVVPAERWERVRYAAAKWKARHPGWNYQTARQPDGSVRIWRTS